MSDAPRDPAPDAPPDPPPDPVDPSEGGQPDGAPSEGGQPARAALEVRPMSSWGAIGWTLAATFVFAWLASLTLSLGGSEQMDLATGFACQIVAYLLALFGVLRVYAPQADIGRFLSAHPTSPGFYLLAVLLGVAITIPVNALHTEILIRFPMADPADHLRELYDQASTVRQVLIGAILVGFGPLLEEVLFRGALYRPLSRRYGPWAVIAITAWLFGLAHASPQAIVPIAVFGLALGVMRWQSGSLLPAVLLHATFNSLPLLDLIQGAGDADSEVETIPLPLVLAGTAATIVLLLIIFQLGSRSPQALEAQQRDAL